MPQSVYPDFPSWLSVKGDLVERINIAWFQKLGIVIGHLNRALLAARFQSLSPAELRYLAGARDWFRALEASEMLPRSAVLARELVGLLTPIVDNPNPPEKLSEGDDVNITRSLTAFNNVLESEANEVFTYIINDVGAYSVAALLEKAECHLSDLAQRALKNGEQKDFRLAGACLALKLFTACGFHAMRATEAVARHYHMIVVGGTSPVDWTLAPLINGNSGRAQVGLRDQWKAEGERQDSQLALIIALLSAISQVYRNPIMHLETVLDEHSAKLVFDISAVAVSTMVADGIERLSTKKTASTTP
jgi:hypothetical protein